MRKLTILLALIPLFCLFCFSCHTNTPNRHPTSPLDVAKLIFGPDSVPDMYRYMTGEYDGTPNGQDLKHAHLRFRVLDQQDSMALINMTVIDSAGRGEDWYLQMLKDTTWKLQTVSSLAMTGMMQVQLEELEQMPQGYLDTLITAAQQDREGNALKMLTSMDDYHFLIGNLRLVLALDDTIVQHFKDNKAAFDTLKNEALKEVTAMGTHSLESPVKLMKQQANAGKALLIENIYAGEWGDPQCITFVIGGMMDNMVGYLYVPDKSHLPDLYDSSLIMLRDLGDGWYMYKTT
ncbi:hypothetical protein CLV59_10866 [Chitinophaga dinghuensis]|uniref:Uncharacterized protein n=1 Tax=Chitinophaga dinghuensis TaxID=1539050 RepID=A0A327VQC1_9BACT|nr:hypothetical protein [Chitinophaga dinghuensis]RAJ76547.1 hypothetical protein CLV59_10866 [Chitinophaga dinghuensis]